MKTITSMAWLAAGVMLFPLVSSAGELDDVKAQNQLLQAQNEELLSDNHQLLSLNQLLQSRNQQLQAHIGRLQHAMAFTVNGDLLFTPGSWEMSDRGKDIIAKIAQKLAPTQEDKLLVSGYTDDGPVGSNLEQQGITSNQQLSQKRADAVMQFLISQGVKSNMVTAQGFGEADPVAPNDTPQGRAQNRRVELSVIGIASATTAQAQQSDTAVDVVTSAPGSASLVRTVQASADVVRIDKRTRTLTLKTKQGDTVDVVASDAVKNFDQIKVGDVVRVRYATALALKLKNPKDAAGGATVSEGSTTAPPGQRPAFTGAGQITGIAEVTAVDPKESTITLKGAEGKLVTLDVNNPDQFKVIKPGDQIEVTYTEAVALDVEPSSK